MFDDPAGATAARARGREHHETAGVRDLAGATALGASLRFAPGLRSRPPAVFARGGGSYAHFAFATECRLAQGQPHLYAEISSAPLPCASAEAATTREH